MRWTALIGLFLAAPAIWGQPEVGSEPSPMEAFAARPGVHVAWSSQIETWNGTTSKMVVTALVLEDSAVPPAKMRGVKIDLSNGDLEDHIYLDETATARTRDALNEISEAVDRRPVSANGCMGAREFWPGYSWPWNKYHELNADYCGAGGGSLSLHGRGRSNGFYFGYGPAALAQLFASALEAVAKH